MSAVTESYNLGDLIKSEERNSREDVMVLMGQSVALGMVVGKVTLSGKVKPLNPSANDGTEIAYGVMIETTAAVYGDKPSAVIRRNANLSLLPIVWPAGITDNQKATALDQLEAHGVTVRAAY